METPPPLPPPLSHTDRNKKICSELQVNIVIALCFFYERCNGIYGNFYVNQCQIRVEKTMLNILIKQTYKLNAMCLT